MQRSSGGAAAGWRHRRSAFAGAKATLLLLGQQLPADNATAAAAARAVPTVAVVAARSGRRRRRPWGWRFLVECRFPLEPLAYALRLSCLPLPRRLCMLLHQLPDEGLLFGSARAAAPPAVPRGMRGASGTGRSQHARPCTYHAAWRMMHLLLSTLCVPSHV